MKKSQALMHSRIGPIYLVASEKGLRGIFWKKQNVPMEKTKVLAKAAGQLEEYLAGKRKKFDVPTDVEGTGFQKKVWKALSGIPYGKTYAYKDIARKIKNPKAVRAVGTANGKNPLCIIVPCHRVISADGSLGGYSGPAGVKNRLLELEQASV